MIFGSALLRSEIYDFNQNTSEMFSDLTLLSFSLPTFYIDIHTLIQFFSHLLVPAVS